MCVTNQDFIAQVVANWKKQGGRSILNLNENDTLGKCICPDCLTADDSSDLTRLKRAREAFIKKNPKWAHELGSLSNRYAKFFLAVQKEADKINPQHNKRLFFSSFPSAARSLLPSVCSYFSADRQRTGTSYFRNRMISRPITNP